MRSPADSARTLPIIRMALLLGALLFGVVVYLTRGLGVTDPVDPASLTLLRLLIGAAIAIGVTGVVALRIVAERQRNPDRLAAQAIVGYALAEGPAIAGGAYYFLAGDPRWYLVGMTVLVAAAVLLPPRR